MTEQISIKPDETLDLGVKACGELVIGLMRKARTIADGKVLEVRALDAGAPDDIPAWCRMTGNKLLDGPCGEGGFYYYIRIAPRSTRT